MQYPAKVLPRASRYFFPRRSCCFWTWKSVKFVWTVCYSEVLKSLQKVSEDSIVLMQSSSSNYRRNRAESFWCRKQQTPFFALIHMSCEAGLSAASAMDGPVIEDYLCWGWGNKNYSLSYFLWRAISALQGYLVSYAMTTYFPLSGCWYRLIFCLEVLKAWTYFCESKAAMKTAVGQSWLVLLTCTTTRNRVKVWDRYFWLVSFLRV